MFKLLVILVVIKFYAQIDIFISKKALTNTWMLEYSKFSKH